MFTKWKNSNTLKKLKILEKKLKDFLKKLTLHETLLASGYQFGCKKKPALTVPLQTMGRLRWVWRPSRQSNEVDRGFITWPSWDVNTNYVKWRAPLCYEAKSKLGAMIDFLLENGGATMCCKMWYCKYYMYLWNSWSHPNADQH